MGKVEPTGGDINLMDVKEQAPKDQRGKSQANATGARWHGAAKQGTLGMNSGGDETANLNEDAKTKYQAQRRYKMEL